MSRRDAAQLWDLITRRPRVSFGAEPWFKNRGPPFVVRAPSQKPEQATPWLPESAEGQPMLAEEVAERLRLIRTEATLYKAPWAFIARAAGVDRETVRRAAHEEMGDDAQRRIGEVLDERVSSRIVISALAKGFCYGLRLQGCYNTRTDPILPPASSLSTQRVRPTVMDAAEYKYVVFRHGSTFDHRHLGK